MSIFSPFHACRSCEFLSRFYLTFRLAQNAVYHAYQVELTLHQDSGWYIHDAGRCLYDSGRYVGEGPRCAVSRNQNFQDINDLLIWTFYIIPSIVTLFGTCHLPLQRSQHLDFLLEKLSRNYDVTRIKSIGGCSQVGRVAATYIWLFFLVVRNPTLFVTVCSMPSSGGNRPRSRHSPRWTRDFRYIPNSLRTPSRWPTPPSLRIHLHIPMLWHSKRCSVVQISWPRVLARLPTRQSLRLSSSASGNLGRRTYGRVPARCNSQARSSPA